MAFIGRGGFQNIGNNTNNAQNNSGNTSPNRYYRGYGYFRSYTYVPLDNTYVIMQMILTFIILITGVITLIFTYKSTIVDPIADMKSLFINTYLIIVFVLLAITLITNSFSKSKESLLKRLAIIWTISIIVMLVFWGIKINMDKTYTESKFEQIYTEQNKPANKYNIPKVDVGLLDVSIKTEQEYYINECLKLYKTFSAKAYGMLAIHLLLNILLSYQIIKVSRMNETKNKLDKDEVVLFDDEENVKF